MEQRRFQDSNMHVADNVGDLDSMCHSIRVLIDAAVAGRRLTRVADDPRYGNLLKHAETAPAATNAIVHLRQVKFYVRSLLRRWQGPTAHDCRKVRRPSDPVGKFAMPSFLLVKVCCT